MPIARQLQWYLDASGVPYEVLPHPHSSSSRETAREAHVPAARLAKPVLLEDERGYVMAIVPASHRVDLVRLNHQLHRTLELAKEREITELFHDCELGAMPPLGGPYRIPPCTTTPSKGPRRSTSRPETTRTWCTCAAGTSCACSMARCTEDSASGSRPAGPSA